MQLQAKECQQSREAGRGEEQVLALSFQRKDSPADTLFLDFKPQKGENTLLLF